MFLYIISGTYLLVGNRSTTQKIRFSREGNEKSLSVFVFIIFARWQTDQNSIVFFFRNTSEFPLGCVQYKQRFHCAHFARITHKCYFLVCPSSTVVCDYCWKYNFFPNFSIKTFILFFHYFITLIAYSKIHTVQNMQSAIIGSDRLSLKNNI